MAEQTKKRSMTTDTTSEISENPKKKKQIRHSDQGKQSKKESDRQRGHWIYGKCGPAITVTAIRCHQREIN